MNRSRGTGITCFTDPIDPTTPVGIAPNIRNGTFGLLNRHHQMLESILDRHGESASSSVRNAIELYYAFRNWNDIGFDPPVDLLILSKIEGKPIRQCVTEILDLHTQMACRSKGLNIDEERAKLLPQQKVHPAKKPRQKEISLEESLPGSFFLGEQ